MAADDNEHVSNDDSKNEECIPPEVMEEAIDIQYNLVPDKSKKIYRKRYDDFKEWCRKKGVINSRKEPVLLAYFNYLHVHMKYCSSTLWSIYSMLKSCFEAFDNHDISKYYALSAFIKKKHKGYKAKKAPTLTCFQVNQFCHEAPDEQFLLAKAILAIGVSGMCRRIGLSNLVLDNVIQLDNQILVTIPYTKTDVERSFKVIGQFYMIVMRYVKARADIPCQKFLVSCRQGKFINVPAGKSTIATVPKIVATFLKLPEPEKYTSHCIRRTSATLYVDNGATLTDLMRMGKWKSSACAQGYIDDSLAMKEKAASIITNAMMPSASTFSNPMSQSVPTILNSFPQTACVSKPSVTCTITRPVDSSPVNVQSPLVCGVSKPGPKVLSNIVISPSKLLTNFTSTPLLSVKSISNASTTPVVCHTNTKPKSSVALSEWIDVPSELFASDFESLSDPSPVQTTLTLRPMEIPTVVVIPPDGDNATSNNDSGLLDLLKDSDESDLEVEENGSCNTPEQKESAISTGVLGTSMSDFSPHGSHVVEPISNSSQEDIVIPNLSNTISNLPIEPVISEQVEDQRPTTSHNSFKPKSINKWLKIPMFQPSNIRSSHKPDESWGNESIQSPPARTTGSINLVSDSVNADTDLKLGPAVLKFVNCTNITIHIHSDSPKIVQPQ